MELVLSCDTGSWNPGEEGSTVLCKKLTPNQIWRRYSSCLQLASSFRYDLIQTMANRIAQSPSVKEAEAFYRKEMDYGFLVQSANSDITPTVEDVARSR
jgi:hypothetical protein